MPKMIGFLGTYPIDLCLYTAFALQNTGRSVFVDDYTREGRLFEMIPTPQDDLEVVSFRNVDFAHKRAFQDCQHYDYVFVELGKEPEDTVAASCDELILVTDCDRAHLDEYQKLMQEMRMSMNVVLRGFCPDGVSERKIKDYFEEENCFVQKWLTLPLDEMDEAYRIGMQYEPMGAFSYASAGLDKLVLQLLKLIAPGHAACNRKALRAVRNGRVLGGAGQ